MYDIYINDISCIEQKILPTTRPDIPAPVKNYNEYDIPGRDGKLYEDLAVSETTVDRFSSYSQKAPPVLS